MLLDAECIHKSRECSNRSFGRGEDCYGDKHSRNKNNHVLRENVAHTHKQRELLRSLSTYKLMMNQAHISMETKMLQEMHNI